MIDPSAAQGFQHFRGVITPTERSNNLPDGKIHEINSNPSSKILLIDNPRIKHSNTHFIGGNGVSGLNGQQNHIGKHLINHNNDQPLHN